VQKIAFLASAALFCSACMPEPMGGTSSQKTPEKMIETARSLVSERLKDPDSARFKGEHVSSKRQVCGLFNGKNAFGAYVGFARFVVKDGAVAILETAESSEEFERAWSEHCH